MARRSAQRTDWRLNIVFIVLILGLTVVCARLVQIQVVDAKNYQKMANQQRLKKILIPPRRGAIFDRSMQEMAVSIETESVFATPSVIKNKPAAANQLAAVLGADEAQIRAKLDSTHNFVYLARKIDRRVAQKVEDLKIEGVSAHSEPKRCYPYNSLAAQLIGFAGMENTGLTGLELYYDKLLRGSPGELVAERDPMGRPIPGGIYYLAPSSDGNDIVLTIDKDIQFKAESSLRSVVESSGAKSGILIAMEPKSGEIIAMANYPTFDLNQANKASLEVVRNRAVTDLYEPGSTMKVVTACAALEEKVVEPSTVFYLPSELKVADRVIGEAHERGAVSLSVADIIIKSSNVGIVKIGQLLQKDRLYKYIERFDLTCCTGIDYPGDVKGLCPKPAQWSGSSIGNIPFGQGISVSALQALRVISVVANDGMLVQPYLLKEVRDQGGRSVGAALRKNPEQVISVETARQMKTILADVVRGGTGKEAWMPDYAVAGKTGTAQKPKSRGGYEENKYIASFIGFVPADTPKLAMIVIIDEPATVIYGGAIAAPVFRDVASFSLRHMKAAPNFIAPE